MSGDERGSPSSYAELISVLSALPILVREKRRRRRISLRAAGEESGVGFNTVFRIEKGEHCSLENTIKLLAWLGGDEPTGVDSPSKRSDDLMERIVARMVRPLVNDDDPGDDGTSGVGVVAR